MWLIGKINNNSLEWTLLGVINANINNVGKELNGYKVLGTTEYLNKLLKDIYWVIGIRDRNIREKIVFKLIDRKFATLIHLEMKLLFVSEIF